MCNVNNINCIILSQRGCQCTDYGFTKWTWFWKKIWDGRWKKYFNAFVFPLEALCLHAKLLSSLWANAKFVGVIYHFVSEHKDKVFGGKSKYLASERKVHICWHIIFHSISFFFFFPSTYPFRSSVSNRKQLF